MKKIFGLFILLGLLGWWVCEDDEYRDIICIESNKLIVWEESKDYIKDEYKINFTTNTLTVYYDSTNITYEYYIVFEYLTLKIEDTDGFIGMNVYKELK